jgi:hypothetical protein
MNRTAAVLVAAVAALILTAAPAAAEDRTMPSPQPAPTQSAEPFPGEQRSDPPAPEPFPGVKHGAQEPQALADTGASPLGLGGLVLLAVGGGLMLAGRRA